MIKYCGKTLWSLIFLSSLILVFSSPGYSAIYYRGPHNSWPNCGSIGSANEMVEIFNDQSGSNNRIMYEIRYLNSSEAYWSVCDGSTRYEDDEHSGNAQNLPGDWGLIAQTNNIAAQYNVVSDTLLFIFDADWATAEGRSYAHYGLALEYVINVRGSHNNYNNYSDTLTRTSTTEDTWTGEVYWDSKGDSVFKLIVGHEANDDNIGFIITNQYGGSGVVEFSAADTPTADTQVVRDRDVSGNDLTVRFPAPDTYYVEYHYPYQENTSTQLSLERKLNHFEVFNRPDSVTWNETFSISLRAVDRLGDTYSNYIGTADLTSSTGTLNISDTNIGNFQQGTGGETTVSLSIKETRGDVTFSFWDVDNDAYDSILYSGTTSIRVVRDTPTFSTATPTNISKSTAQLNMDFTDMGDYDEVEAYYEWRQEGAAGWNKTDTALRTTATAYDTQINGLTASETYVFRAVLDLKNGDTATADTRSFQTTSKITPTVTNQYAADTTVSQGKISVKFDTGDYDTVTVYFNWRADTVDAWEKTAEDTFYQPATDTETLTGLASDTDYRYQPILRYNDGQDTTAGSEATFRTAKDTPTITTDVVLDTGTDTVSIQGTYNTVDYETSAVSFQYRKSGLSTWNSTTDSTVSGSGNYSDTTGGLESAEKYEWRAFLKYNNEADTLVGDTQMFRTDTEPPSVTTSSASEIDTNSATLNGSWDAGSYNVDVYFQWRRLGDNTWKETSKNTKSKNSTDNYSAGINDLQVANYYEFRSAADTAGNGTIYGDTIVFFTTKSETMDLYCVGSFSDWIFNDTAVMFGYKSPLNKRKNIIRVDTGTEFKFATSGYSSDWGAGSGWADTSVDPSNVVWTLNGSPDDLNLSFENVSKNEFVTVTSQDNPGNIGEDFGFMKSAEQPVYLDWMENQQDIGESDTVGIEVHTSAVPGDSQNIFVRWSPDGWASDTVVMATGSGTSYTATIPAQEEPTTVEYYGLVTTANTATLETNPDLLTIHLNNNGGANYSYVAADQPIIVDGDLSDWPDTSILPAAGANDFRVLWGDTKLFIGFDRGSAFPINNGTDTTAIFTYIDNEDSASRSTTGAPASWTAHTLPVGFNYHFVFIPNSNGAGNEFVRLRAWSGSWQTINWTGNAIEHNNNGVAEMSIPWEDLDNPSQIRAHFHAVNDYNGYLWGRTPNANKSGYGVNLTTYLDYPDTTQSIKPNAGQWYKPTSFLSASDTSVVSFTPLIDGSKDGPWGDTPDVMSDGAKEPKGPTTGDGGVTFPDSGLVRGLYVTNDIDYLYVGWDAWGNRYDNSKSMHYGVVVGDSYADGFALDPWASTTQLYQYGAEVWQAGYIQDFQDNFASMIRYTMPGDTLAETGLTLGEDYSMSAENKWAETRIPLSEVNARIGDSVSVILYARHQGDKPGINDLAPYQSGVATNWADTAANIDAAQAVTYTIQEEFSDLSHIPNQTPIEGMSKMRSPLTPTSRNNVEITLSVTPSSLTDQGYLVYTTDAWISKDTVALNTEITSGASRYLIASIPNQTQGTSVEYYLQTATELTNYVYGTNDADTVTNSKSEAQNNAYQYTVQNSPPTAPDTVTLIPRTPARSDDLTVQTEGISEPDANDTTTVIFEWYKNGVQQASLTAEDTTFPYADTVSASNTATGDTWIVDARAGDGVDTSNPVASNAVKLSDFIDWTAPLPERVDEALLTDSEWVFRDKSGEQRSVESASNFDLEELRFKLTAENLYFRARFRDITDTALPLLGVSFDTDGQTGSGGTILADESNLNYGTQYYGSEARWEIQFMVHSAPPGKPIVELKTAPAGSWTEASDYGVYLSSQTDVLEVRIDRSELLGSGANLSLRTAIALFRTSGETAAAGDATKDYSTVDALDGVSIAPVYGTAPDSNDADFQLDAMAEDLEDGAMDFWFQLETTADSLAAGTAPERVDLLAPADGGSTSARKPSFTWEKPAENDSWDTVTSFQFEINETNDFSGSVLARYNLASGTTSFELPFQLAASATYYWRVRARDKTGSLSGDTVGTFSTNAAEISAYQPVDNTANQNNLGQIQGGSTSDSAITWEWPRAEHSLGWAIKDYNIQVSTDSSFNSVLFSDTLYGSAALGGTTTYTISDTVFQTQLERGEMYYARIRAGDTGTPQNWSDFSASSDGIFFSLKNIDARKDDWAVDTGWIGGSIHYFGDSLYEGIWADTVGDQRVDIGSVDEYLDLKNFRVASDRINLYLLINMANWDGSSPYLQIPLDYNNSATERVYRGTGEYDEDSYTHPEAPWKYMLHVLVDQQAVWVTNNNANISGGGAFETVGTGRYTENANDSFVEVAIPYKFIDGAEQYTGETISLSPAVFYWNEGLAEYGANNSNIVDLITNEGTFNEIDDQVVDFTFDVNFDSRTRVASVQATPYSFTGTPETPNQDGSPKGEHRDYIIYNIFSTDRWLDGGGPEPYDPDMTSGDYMGTAEKKSLNYINKLGANAIKLSPEAQFGGGAWGYNQSDLYQIQRSYVEDHTNKYNGWNDFVDFLAAAKRHNIVAFPDLVPGQIYGNRQSGGTIEKNPYIAAKEGGCSRFGGRQVWEHASNARQWFVDNSRFLYGLGVEGFRVDNPKFYGGCGSSNNRGHQETAYYRHYWDQFAPNLYTFGEIPAGPSTIAGYIQNGDRLNGANDEPTMGSIHSWSEGHSAADLKNALDGNISAYVGSVRPANTAMLENHDGSARLWHEVGEDIYNVQNNFLWLAVNPYNPYWMYGDEKAFGGKKDCTYPGWDCSGDIGTGENGVTRKFWFDCANDPGGLCTEAIKGTVGDAMAARAIFDALTFDYNSFTWERTDNECNGCAIIDRGGGVGEVIVLLNPTDGSASFDNIPVDNTGGCYEDWMPGGGGYICDGDNDGDLNSYSVDGNYAAILKEGGFDKTQLEVQNAPEGGIISVSAQGQEPLSTWTREVGSSGSMTVTRLLQGTYDIHFWAPNMEYQITSKTLDGSDTYDPNEHTGNVVAPGPPAAPLGLRAEARDEAVVLEWEDNTEIDCERYEIWRAKGEPSNFEKVIEVMNSTYYDNDLDKTDKLTNGTRYYYKLRAVDRNGNKSAFTNVTPVVPNDVSITFQIDLSNSGLAVDSIKKVYMEGNSKQLGRHDMSGVTSYPKDPLVEMKEVGRNIWEVTLDGFNPTELVQYVHLVEYNNPDWEWSTEYGSFQSSITFEDGRDFFVPAPSKEAHTIVRQWNTEGNQAPQNPIGLSTACANQKAKLGWSLNYEADIKGYRIYRSSTSSDKTDMNLINSTDSRVVTYTDLGLTNGDTYWYRMKAEDFAGKLSPFSAPVSVVPCESGDTFATVAPTNLALQSIGKNKIKLTWDRVTDPNMAGYHVYRDTETGIELTAENKLNETLLSGKLNPTFVDENASPGVKYHYTVTTANTVGTESDSASEKSAQLSRVTFRVDPGGISNINSMQIRSGKPFIGRSPGDTMSPESNSTFYRYTTDLISGRPFQYRYAYNRAHPEADWSTTSSGDRKITVPAVSSKTYTQDWQGQPVQVMNTSGQPDTQAVWLFWDKNIGDTDVVGYNVYRQTENGKFVGPLNNSPISNKLYHVTELEDGSNLKNGTNYSFTIRAQDGGDLVLESVDSKIISVTPNKPVYVHFRN